MNEDELLRKYGLHPSGDHLDDVRDLLTQLTHMGPDVDTELMKLCCVQLFHHGSPDDVLRIWQAKESGWDAHCSIDAQLLCGAGLEATKAFLANHPHEEARSALDYLARSEEAGDFDGFSVAGQSAWYHQYYDVATGNITG